MFYLIKLEKNLVYIFNILHIIENIKEIKKNISKILLSNLSTKRIYL